LLAQGLREGEDGIAFSNAAAVQALILDLNRAAPRDPDTESFEEDYRRFPHHAQSTMHGAAIEIAILFIYWLSKTNRVRLANRPAMPLPSCPKLRDCLKQNLRTEA